MSSVIDFIDKQKHIIQSQRKTIQTLYEFLKSIDKSDDEKTESNGVKNEIGTNGLLSWIGSQKSEQKRQQLAEERHQEYNDFLKLKKSKLKSRDSEKSSKRITKLIPDYNDILNTKRKEEQKHRQSNGFDIEDIEDLEEKRRFVGLPQIGWSHCSNNKFVNGYITPRSRLLATHSSRVKAAKYAEELKKQVEEKERLKAEERQRIRLEEEKLEHKLETQRLKMLKEFEEEHRPLRQQTEQKSIEDNKESPNRDQMIGSTTPLSLLRSPTYRHMKETQPLNRYPRKSSAVSRSLASALSPTMRNTQSMATQTSDEQKHFLTSEESSDCESSLSSEEDNKEDDKSKEVEFRRRVLSQLSDVRQMMESDHIKMMEQLRHQQLSQLDE